MKLTALKLVTVITESVLEEQLTRELKKLGATGYTVVPSRGQGSRGMRAGEIPGENIRIEVVVGEEVAGRIMAHLSANYFKDYAVICYLTDVSVLRGEKYV